MNAHVYLRLWGYMKGNDPARVRVQRTILETVQSRFSAVRVVRELAVHLRAACPRACAPAELASEARLTHVTALCALTGKLLVVH